MLYITNNEPPNIVIDTPYRGVEGEAINFKLLVSDIDGSISKIRWSFGDGEISNEKNPAHVYEEPGEYKVVIRAVDDLGDETETSTLALISSKYEWRFPKITIATVIVLGIIYCLYWKGIIGSKILL
jgi:PKD repeat protein